MNGGELSKDLTQYDAFNVHQAWWESVNTEFDGVPLTERERTLVRCGAASAFDGACDWMRAKSNE